MRVTEVMLQDDRLQPLGHIIYGPTICGICNLWPKITQQSVR